MFPYLIAGAIGFVVAKLTEKDEPKYEDGGSVLLAPNGKPSNLTPEQYKLVRTPAFKEWFGDWENDPANASKVVDENGEPLVVWRGVKANNYDYQKKGYVYFAKNKSYAQIYGDTLYPFFLNIRNPLDLEFFNKISSENGLTSFNNEGLFQIGETQLNNQFENELDLLYMQNLNDVYTKFDYLFKNGDGIVGYDIGSYGEELVFVTKQPNQIKLADGTNTTFDGNNPDIRYAGGGNILLAPNGKPSNLTPEQYKLVRTKAFKDWFGDWENDPANASKVVDENGEPLVCVHNTHRKFNVFDEKYIGTNTDDGFYGKGFYFNAVVGYLRYGGIELYCFLNIKNPYLEEVSDEIYKLNSDKLKNKGFDGVIVISNWKKRMNLENGFSEIIAYYPNQIKLADGTNTTFDSNNPDIRFDGGGEINNYKEFFDNLEIEDGSKYIGMKFGDVFPYLKGRRTPNDFRIYIKQYRGVLKRLKENKYTLSSMRNRDLNKLKRMNNEYLEKKLYLSKFNLDSKGNITSFQNM